MSHRVKFPSSPWSNDFFRLYWSFSRILSMCIVAKLFCNNTQRSFSREGKGLKGRQKGRKERRKTERKNERTILRSKDDRRTKNCERSTTDNKTSKKGKRNANNFPTNLFLYLVISFLYRSSDETPILSLFSLWKNPRSYPPSFTWF